MKFEIKIIKVEKSLVKKKKLILKYINNFVNSVEKNFRNIPFLDLPNSEVKFFLKKSLLENFNLKNNSFDKKLKLINYYKYFFIYIYYTLFIFFCRKKNTTKRSREFFLLLDNLGSKNEKLLYKDIKKTAYKNNYLIRVTNKTLVNRKNEIFAHRYKNYTISFKEFLQLFKILFSAVKISFFHRVNFIYLALKLVDTILFYKSFFQKYRVNNIVMHQHYLSSNVKNFYFKKYGGSKSCLIQKNIPSLNTNNDFIHCDIFFSIGENCQVNNNFTNSKINTTVNIGSIFMNKFKKTIDKNLYVKKKYDVICLGGNALMPNGYYDTYDTYNSDYKSHLEWLVKLKKNNPKLKIVFKHHSNNVDDFEKNILAKSGITILDQSLNSYREALKAKFICSWASTMILEMKSLNYYSYFLDPESRNHQFLYQLNNRKNISINTFGKFQKLVLKSLKEKNIKKFNNGYCFDYKKVIFNIIKKLETK